MDHILEIIKAIINHIAPFWISLILIIFLFFSNRKGYKKKYNRFRFQYIYQPNKLKRFTFRLSLLYTFILFGLIINIVFYSHNPNNDKFIDWFLPKLNTYFAIFFSLLLSIWGLIVTYNVLKQQKNQIVSFEDFLLELTDALQTLIIDAKKNINKQFEVYLYDYHPLIGNYSAPKRFNEYKKVLDEILIISNINVTFITNHQDDLAIFFQKLAIDDDKKILENSFDAVNFIKNIEINTNPINQQKNNSIIWKSSNISEYHFVLVDDISFQYVVLPVVLPDGTNKNQIFGIKSEDPFILNYLKNTFKEKLKTMISPKEIIYKNDDTFEIYFEPQSNIEDIIIYDNIGSEIYKTNELIYYNDIDINGFKIKEYNIKNYPFYYAVRKKRENIGRDINGRKVENDDRAVKSRKIFYRELLSAKPHINNIKYIIPFDIEGKNLIDYCLREYSDFISHNVNVLSVNIFFDPDEFDIINDIKLKFEEINSEIPINYISQIPESRLAIEIMYTNDNVKYGNNYNFKYSIVERESHFEYYFVNTHFDANKTLEENIKRVFENFVNLQNSLNLEYKDIYRQWNYVGNIIKKYRVGNKEIDNYNKFCGVRKDIFNKVKLEKPNFPVATGIGCNFANNFTLSAIALKAKDGSELISRNLKIDTQKDPDQYSDKVVFGPHKPLFQRGKHIIIGNLEYYFISGTSSIQDEKSWFLPENRLYSQVSRTIESMVDLLNIDSDKHISIRNLSYLRIYYTGKNKDDLNILKTYLYPIIKDVPHIFLKTDICRNDLHIEIEGAKF